MSNFYEASARHWLTALAFIAPAISSRPPAPSLAFVYIDPRTGNLTAHDYEVTADATLEGGTGMGKPFLVHYGNLKRAINEITKGDRTAPVKVTAVQHADADNGHYVTVEAAGYTVTLNGHPATDWLAPARLKATSSMNVDGRDLKTAIQRVNIAASQDDTLPILTAISFEHWGGVLSLMATDRYRLALSKLPTLKRSRTTTKFLVKAKTMADVARRITKKTRVKIENLNDGKSVRFNLPGGTLQTLTTDGDYPDIEKLFPERLNTSFVIDRASLLAAARVAATMAERNTPAILDFTQQGVVLTFNEGLFDASTTPLAKGIHVGHAFEPVRVAYNPFYLVEAITAITGDKLIFGLTRPEKPAQLTEAVDGPQHKHLVMPVRTPTKAHA